LAELFQTGSFLLLAFRIVKKTEVPIARIIIIIASMVKNNMNSLLIPPEGSNILTTFVLSKKLYPWNMLATVIPNIAIRPALIPEIPLKDKNLEDLSINVRISERLSRCSFLLFIYYILC